MTTVAQETHTAISLRGEMCRGLLSTKTNFLKRREGLAELVVTGDSIRLFTHLPAFRWDFTIAKSDIARIEPAGFFPWFWMGVRIRHNNPNLPKSLKFVTWQASKREIMAVCREQGFPTAR